VAIEGLPFDAFFVILTDNHLPFDPATLAFRRLVT
jgi:hypothetical protein